MSALVAAPASTDITEEARARAAVKIRRQFSTGTNSLYTGTQFSTSRATLPRNTYDSYRTVNRYTRLQGLSIARWLYANEGFVKGIIDDMASYSVGTGFTPIPQDAPDLSIPDNDVKAYAQKIGQPVAGAVTPEIRRNIAQHIADANNAAHADYFVQASKVLNVAGGDLDEDLDLTSKAIDVDGDIGFLLCETDSAFPQYQIWQGHRIGSGVGIVDGSAVSFITQTPDGDTVTVAGKIYDGVILDDVMRPVGFRLLVDELGNFQDVPAWNFIWLGERSRTDEGRTMTNLVHALENGQDRMEIIGIEKDGLKVTSTPGLVLYTDEADDMLGMEIPAVNRVAVAGDQCAPGNGNHIPPPMSREALRAGMIVRRSKGDKLESHQVNRPNPALKEFDEVLAAPIAQGMGLPLGFVYRPEDLKGAAMKLVTAKAKRRFSKRQRLLIRRLLNRLYFWIISKGIKLGDIPQTREPWRVKWQVTQSIVVDAGREAMQDRADIWAGHRTLQEDAAERGMDWKQIKRQKAIEAAYDYELAQEFGVPVERIATISANPTHDVPDTNEDTDTAKPAGKPSGF